MLGSPSHNFRAGLDAKFSCKALFALEGLLILATGNKARSHGCSWEPGVLPSLSLQTQVQAWSAWIGGERQLSHMRSVSSPDPTPGCSGKQWVAVP